MPASQPYDYGCLMLDLDVPGWDALVGRIPVDQLYRPGSVQYGRETTPHATILFGFHDAPGLGAELLDKLPVDLPALTASGGIEAVGCDYFETPDYDVVKLSLRQVESPAPLGRGW